MVHCSFNNEINHVPENITNCSGISLHLDSFMEPPHWLVDSLLDDDPSSWSNDKILDTSQCAL